MLGAAYPRSHWIKSNLLLWESQFVATWSLLLLDAVSTSPCLSENSPYSLMPTSLSPALLPSGLGELSLSF